MRTLPPTPSPSNPLHPKKTDYKRVAIIGGAVVLLYLYLRSRSTGSGTTAVLPVQTAVDPTTTGATNDLLGQLSSQMASQNNALGAILGGSTTTGPAATPGAEPQVGALAGSGYFGPPGGGVEQTPTGNYQYVATPAQALAIGDANLFFQPLPGVFAPWNNKTAVPGTPEFAQVPFGSAAQQQAQTAVVAAAAGH